jgi:hypothetical protein
MAPAEDKKTPLMRVPPSKSQDPQGVGLEIYEEGPYILLGEANVWSPHRISGGLPKR